METISRIFSQISAMLQTVEIALKGKEHGVNHPIHQDTVYQHTLRVLENLPEDASKELICAAVYHDIGKSVLGKIAKNKDGSQYWAYGGHPEKSAQILEQYRFLIEAFGANFERVSELVLHHDDLFPQDPSENPGLLGKISMEIIPDLIALARADQASQTRKDGKEAHMAERLRKWEEAVNEHIAVCQ